ncbi:MAG: hypothetical protein IM572_07890 [Chitinophagaceae bacterium]|nr:hypothetical protein [Chitinophagaceae bacterium]
MLTGETGYLEVGEHFLEGLVENIVLIDQHAHYTVNVFLAFGIFLEVLNCLSEAVQLASDVRFAILTDWLQ